MDSLLFSCVAICQTILSYLFATHFFPMKIIQELQVGVHHHFLESCVTCQQASHGSTTCSGALFSFELFPKVCSPINKLLEERKEAVLFLGGSLKPDCCLGLV